MQRYFADHYHNFFTCYFQPTPNYRRPYNSVVAFHERLPRQPFTSSFSIDALLCDTNKERSQQEILPPTPRQKKSVSEKLREFEEKRRRERKHLSTAMFQVRVQAEANANSSQAQHEEGIEPTEFSPEEGRNFVCPSLRHKRPRTMFTMLQLERMEREFQRRQYITGNQRHQLAEELELSETQVRVWFQNRRIKWRKEMIKSQF